MDKKERRLRVWLAARAVANTPARLAAASFDRLRSTIRALPESRQGVEWKKLDEWLTRQSERLDS